MNFTNEEYKSRLKKVQASMQEKGIELLISQDPSNMNYLTGYDAWSFYYAQCVIVHVNADERPTGISAMTMCITLCQRS